MFALDLLARNVTTCAFQDQPSCGNVPQPDSPLDVSIKPAAGHIAQIERSGTHNAQLTHAMGQLLQQGQSLVQIFPALGQANGNNSLFEVAPFANTNNSAIESRHT